MSSSEDSQMGFGGDARDLLEDFSDSGSDSDAEQDGGGAGQDREEEEGRGEAAVPSSPRRTTRSSSGGIDEKPASQKVGDGVVDPKAQMRPPDRAKHVFILPSPHGGAAAAESSRVVLTSLPLPAFFSNADDREHTGVATWGRFAVLPERNMLCELQTLRHPPSSWFVDEVVVQDGALIMGTPVDPLFLLLPKLEQARGSESPGMYRDLVSILDTGASLGDGSGVAAGGAGSGEGDESGAAPGWAHILRLFSEPDSVHLQSLCAVCDHREIWDGDDKQLLLRLNDERLVAWLRAKVQILSRALGSLDKSVSASSAKASTFVEADTAEKKLTPEQMVESALGFLSEYVSQKWLDRAAEACGAAAFRPTIAPREASQQTLTALTGSKRGAGPAEPDEEAVAREEQRRKLTHNVRHKQLEKAVTKNQGRITAFFGGGKK